MNDTEAIQKFGLPANPTSREEICAAFEQALRNEGTEESDHELILCLAAQLFSIGNVEDCLLIWRAKSDNFDLGCSIDVQLLCGAGIEETKSYLAAHGSEDALKALKYLQRGIEAGDFKDWSVPKWIAYYRRYYHLDSQAS
jgi:hypothetical protein